jgi:hypothetical protein
MLISTLYETINLNKGSILVNAVSYSKLITGNKNVPYLNRDPEEFKNFNKLPSFDEIIIRDLLNVLISKKYINTKIFNNYVNIAGVTEDFNNSEIIKLDCDEKHIKQFIEETELKDRIFQS